MTACTVGLVNRLTGRPGERNVLDRLIGAVRGGESRALVLRGEPGVGKTALLEYIVERAPECRLARTAGVQSEMELAFAGCWPRYWITRKVSPVRSAMH